MQKFYITKKNYGTFVLSKDKGKILHKIKKNLKLVFKVTPSAVFVIVRYITLELDIVLLKYLILF